jgi:hypothetical protein
MRRLTRILATLALVVSGCWSAQCESTNESLTFFIVSEQKINGGRFIDSTNFPKLGYVAAKPDLMVTNLADVFPAKVADSAIMVDGKGKPTIVPTHPPPSLTVKLTPPDAKRFTELTERALDKQLLIMLGDKPLTAPKVLSPIETSEFLIEFTGQAELQRTEKILKRLVH